MSAPASTSRVAGPTPEDDSSQTARVWWRREWVPTGMVVLLAILLLRAYAHLEVLQSLRFAAYVVGWLVLPGTVLWRLVDPRQREGRRPLAEDLALGALVGLIAEFPAYLLCLVAGVPWLYAGWPLVWVVGLLALRGRRDVMHLGAPSVHRGWPWVSGLLVAYQVLWFARVRWATEPITDNGYARGYFDEYFHLGVVAALRRSWPPEYLQVTGPPVKYHWLSHLNVAASSYATGLEPAVLLHALTLPTVVVLSTVALARVAVRLTDAEWTGPVTLLAVAVTSAAFPGWVPAATGMMSLLNLLSPAAGFATATLVLAMLVLIEALRAPRLRPHVVATVAFALFALFGAKSTSLPPLVAGLAAATVVGGLRDRKLLKRGAVLTMTALAVFVAGTAFFIGFGSSEGLEVHPLNLAGVYVEDYLPAPITQVLMPGQVAASLSWSTKLVAFSAVLGYVGFGLGHLCLLTRSGWRRPDHVFVVASLTAGVGAAFTVSQIGHSERYFGYGMLPMLVLGAVLGLHRTCARLHARSALRYAGAALLGGLVAGVVVLRVGRVVLPHRPSTPALHVALTMVAGPVALSLVLAGVVCVGVSWAVTRRSSRPDLMRCSLPVTACAALAGIGLTYPVMLLDNAVRHPQPVANVASEVIIGPGGIEAARWVRSHAPAETVLATNAHCLFTGVAPPCDARQFWMAAYSERPFLVEGWSFLNWSLIGKKQPTGTNVVNGPFWDPALLAANDAAFDQPSVATVSVLRRHHVGWLLVDTRYRVDLPRLRQYAEVVYQQGDYVVLRLR